MAKLPTPPKGTGVSPHPVTWAPLGLTPQHQRCMCQNRELKQAVRERMLSKRLTSLWPSSYNQPRLTHDTASPVLDRGILWQVLEALVSGVNELLLTIFRLEPFRVKSRLEANQRRTTQDLE